MSEQGTAVRTHGRAETFHRRHGDADECGGKDWPLAAPIFGAVAGIYAAAVIGIYELVTSAGRDLLASAGWVALILSCGLFAIVLAGEVNHQRMRVHERRSEELGQQR
jgi:hypothetical protein